MKKRMIPIGILLFCVLCGIGAYLCVRKGAQAETKESEPPQLSDIRDITIAVGEELPKSIYEVKGSEEIKEVRVDISKVDTMQEGSYPITYRYTDQEGKVYESVIQCQVIRQEKSKDTENLPDEGRVQESEEQSKIQEQEANEKADGLEIPKTGEADEQGLIVYAVLWGMSAATIYSRWTYREQKL